MQHVQYAIRELYPIAEKIEASGGSIAKVNIGDPVPYFGTPRYVLVAYAKAVLAGKTHYGRSPGETEFQKAIADRYARLYRTGLDPQDIFVTHGVSEAFAFLNTCLMEEGRGCIMLSPYYSADLPLVLERGGKAYFAECDESKGWGLDLGKLERCLRHAKQDGRRIEFLSVINPCNPTGAVFGRSDLEALAAFAREHELLLVSDETYDEIVFDKSEGPFVSMCEVARDQPLAVMNGLSKNWAGTGMRIGWLALTGAGGKMDALRDGLSRLATVRLCAGVAQQHAGVEALNNTAEHKKFISHFTAEVGKRSKQFCTRLNEVQGISCVPAKGAFYLFPKVDLAAANCKTDSEFVRLLLEEQHVWAVQGSGFGCGGHIRVVTLPPLEIIDRACDGIAKMMKTG